MNRTGWFLAILVAGVVVFVGVTLAAPGFVSTSTQGGMMGVGYMMSWWLPSGGMYSYPSLIWLLPVGALILVGVGFVGVIYGLAYPRMPLAQPAQAPLQPPVLAAGNLDAVMMTLKPDEKMLMEVLKATAGPTCRSRWRRRLG
jgi:hypothetical protein